MAPSSDSDLMRTVPDLVGLNYEEATDLARRSELHLADPDPDAPPLASSWWEHQDLVVRTQDPPAGAFIDRRRSVTVTLAAPHAPVGARVRRHVPPALSAEAEPESAP